MKCDNQGPIEGPTRTLIAGDYIIPDGFYAEINIEGRIVVVRKKESEDERIRKEIVNFIRWAVDRGSITKAQRERSDSWLAYLDKLKEKSEKPIIPEWSEEDEAFLKVAIAICNRYSHKDIADWLKNLRERIKSLRPQHNLRWRRAKAGENIPESIILPDGDDPRFGKCAVRDSYYIPISELKELPKDGND